MAGTEPLGLPIEPLTVDELLDLRGTGWGGDLAAMRGDDRPAEAG